jgi:hypothetical protein
LSHRLSHRLSQRQSKGIADQTEAYNGLEKS